MMNEELTRVSDSKEIQSALKGMNPDGIPGPDGFSVAFICMLGILLKLTLSKPSNIF